MKNLVVLSILVLMSTKILSQDITFFFQNLPDEAFNGLKKEYRKKIVDNDSSIKTNDMQCYFKADGVCGNYGCYLGMAGTRICYWDISNGNFLIAIWNSTPPPTSSWLSFCYYDGKDFKLLNLSDVMPEDDLLRNFFKNYNEENINRISSDLMEPFPLIGFHKDGLNMTMYLYIGNDKEKYKKYGIIGDKMELIWNDGKFTKGKVYWSE